MITADHPEVIYRLLILKHIMNLCLWLKKLSNFRKPSHVLVRIIISIAHKLNINEFQGLGKLIQSGSDTYRSYCDPSSTVILAKELSGKTKSTALMMKADGCAKTTRFANNRNHTNKSPLKGILVQTNINANSEMKTYAEILTNTKNQSQFETGSKSSHQTGMALSFIPRSTKQKATPNLPLIMLRFSSFLVNLKLKN